MQIQYPAVTDNEVVSKIAENIKAIRLKKNLTIKQLADKTQVTKGLLSKIENSKAIPSLPVFVQILKSLDTSFQDFFQAIDSVNHQKYILIRKAEMIFSTSEGQGGIEYRNIVETAIPASTFAISLLELNRNTNGHSEIVSGSRFDHVISGNCEYQMANNEVICMERGDSIYFNGPGAHVAFSTSENAALILVIHLRF